MTLLNASALFAAVGILVPIIIHLHRKRKARIVEWPAMQFLTNTLASRRRGLALENLLLLLVRCLVIMLFVLAMAQPLLPSGGFVQLAAWLALMTGGLVGLAVASIRSLTPRTRVAGFIAASVLLTGAAATLTIHPEDFDSPTQNCDLVIVIDETSSMLTDSQQGESQQGTEHQESRFTHAVDEALLLVDQLSGSSTVSIIRCGPVIETLTGSPFRDLPAAETLLTELRPTGGGANTSDAIQQAVALAKKGSNPFKQVVLFTDDQLRTWESLDEFSSLQVPPVNSGTAVTSDAKEEKQDDRNVHLAVHLAKLPDRVVNVSVVDIRIETPVPAVGQSLVIEADVRNHGDAAVADLDIQLLVDGKPFTTESVDALSPATTTTIRFPYTFETAGEHVVTVQTEFPDALMDDNRYDMVVSVVPYVSILLVNGNAFAKPGDQSATFLELALDPGSRGAIHKREASADRPIRVESVDVSALSEMESLSDYDVIVLSEVPQLPDEIATSISSYVAEGGGLWVIPDRHVNVGFYNDWKTKDSETRLLPATLMDHQQRPLQHADDNAGQTRVDLQAIASDFVKDLIKTGEHDLTEVAVSGYRKVTLTESAVVGMKFTNGDPLFVEQTVGQGRVLLQTVALGMQDCNLPQRVCFPVLMHLWSYDLADCRRNDANFEPALELSVPVSSSGLTDVGVDSLLLIDPAGEERVVHVVQHSQSRLAQVSPAGRPGVYTLSAQNTRKNSQSFTVARDGRESDLAVVSKEKLNALQSAHDIQWLADAESLRIAGVPERSEHDLSPDLILTVLCLIAAESLLAVWIRRRRAVTNSPQPAAAQQMRPRIRSNPTVTARVPRSDAEAHVAAFAGGAK
ncbi:MAG: BatA domain-containing protein [Planctomycetaceae bacterium]